MKKILFAIVLFPLLGHAQKDDDPTQKHNNGKLNFVQANKSFSQPAVRKDDSQKRLKDDNVYVGNVKFQIGSTGIMCDSAISYTNEGTIALFHVKIFNPESFDIKGDALHYTKEDNIGTLTDDVTVTAQNGAVVGTTNSLKIDFSYEIDRIIDGSLTPPKKDQ